MVGPDQAWEEEQKLIAEAVDGEDAFERVMAEERGAEQLTAEWQRVKERVEAMLADPDQECVGKIEVREPCDGRYWGVWHSKGGWLIDCDGMMFWTASKKHAGEQLKVSRSLNRYERMDPDLWEVREIGGGQDG